MFWVGFYDLDSEIAAKGGGGDQSVERPQRGFVVRVPAIEGGDGGA